MRLLLHGGMIKFFDDNIHTFIKMEVSNEEKSID